MYYRMFWQSIVRKLKICCSDHPGEGRDYEQKVALALLTNTVDFTKMKKYLQFSSI